MEFNSSSTYGPFIFGANVSRGSRDWISHLGLWLNQIRNVHVSHCLSVFDLHINYFVSFRFLSVKNVPFSLDLDLKIKINLKNKTNSPNSPNLRKSLDLKKKKRDIWLEMRLWHWLVPNALMTFPKVANDLLIVAPSFNRKRLKSRLARSL